MNRKTVKIKPRVSAFLAALNEEENVGKTVRECFSLKDYSMEVFVVIDSKTTDKTAAVARKAGASIIDTGRWNGKGYALRMAQKKATGNYIVQIDADYQFLPRDIPKMIKALERGADVAIATRYRRGAHVETNSVTPLRRFGIFFLALATSFFAKTLLTDVLAGFKVFKTEVIKDLKLRVNHYGYEAEEVIRAAQKGYKVVEVPVHYKKRIVGNSKLVPFKHGFLFLQTILETGLSR